MPGTDLTHGLPSPANSLPSTTTSVVGASDALPTPRAHPLRPGSTKETTLINYLDARVQRINARHAKKFSNDPNWQDTTPGYESFDEVVADIEPLVDVVWASGTPNIQIPYLLSLAGIFCSFMPDFPFVVAIFKLASKLDTAFASMISQYNSITGQVNLSTTEKVRIKSLVEETRVVAVRTAAKSGHNPHPPEPADDTTDDNETETDSEDMPSKRDDGALNLDDRTISTHIAKLYEHTLDLLGDVLGDLPVRMAHADSRDSVDGEVEEIEL